MAKQYYKFFVFYSKAVYSYFGHEIFCKVPHHHFQAHKMKKNVENFMIFRISHVFIDIFFSQAFPGFFAEKILGKFHFWTWQY